SSGRMLLEGIDAWPGTYGRGVAVRAILEGVAFALREQLHVLCNGARPELIRCSGGGAQSALWLQIKADVLGMTTTAMACPEPTSLGAALLALRTLTGAALP